MPAQLDELVVEGLEDGSALGLAMGDAFVRTGPGFAEVFFDPIEPGDGLQWGGGEGLAGLEGLVIFAANMPQQAASWSPGCLLAWAA
jgi:hypothetical protein